MVVNPAIPLETFIPPDDFSDVHVLASKDQNGFNAGMFFIRAHKWSISLLANAMTLEGLHPEVIAGFAEQTALYIMFNETTKRDHVLFQPRKWFNTYEWSFAYEGQPGDLYVHFVGLLEDRWSRMIRWLDILEGMGQRDWEIPLEHTKYPAEINDFWSTLRAAKSTVADLRHKVSIPFGLPSSVQEACDRLELVLWSETDQLETLRNATEQLETAIKNTPGLTSAGTG